MAVIDGVVTEDGRKYWPQLFGGLMGAPSTVTVPGTPPTSWDPRIKFFRVGEGGWEDQGFGKQPRVPDPTLRLVAFVPIQELDAIVDLTRAPADQRYPANSQSFFTKNLTATDFVFEPPSTIRVRCFLNFADYNDDGFGNNPEIWEIGLYSDHPESPLGSLMVAYGTFPMEVKNNGKQIQNDIRITF